MRFLRFTLSAFPRLPLCGVMGALLLGLSVAQGHETHDERIAVLAKKLAERPEDPALHYALAEANCEHGDWQVTLLNLDTVERLAPGAFPTPVLRGQALLNAGKFARTTAVLDPWIAAHPQDAAALLLRARALSQMEPPAAALPDFRETLRLVPAPEPDLVDEVATALAKNGCADEAAQVFATAIQRLGPIPSLMLRALDLELAAGNYDAALARVETLRQSAPRPEPWMERRAEILLQAGRLEDARSAWKALLDHLAALPPAVRGSHALSLCAERVQHALTGLENLSAAAPAALTTAHPSR